MKAENWIKWDLDSRTGWRMAGFVSEFGATGYGVFLILTEQLYRAEDHRLSFDTNAYRSYANVCKVEQDDLEQMIGALVLCGLFERDDEFFWSPRVKSECEARDAKAKDVSNKRQLAVNTRWEKERSAEKQHTNDYNSIQTDTNNTRLDKSRLDKSRLDKRERESAPALVKLGTVLSMEPSQVTTLESVFGAELLAQEIPEADIWLVNADTPSARKYRKPNYNHYLFFRNWCKDKKIRFKGSTQNGRQSNADQVMEVANKVIQQELLKEKMQNEQSRTN